MAFLEQTISDLLALGFAGGPRFKTTVVQTDSGKENRNADWQFEKRRFDLGYAGRTQTEKDAIEAMFLIAKGKANGWRLRDPGDYTTSGSNGKLELGQGLGVPSYELYKTYTLGSYSYSRRIYKPRAGAIFYRNAVAVTTGGGAGQISTFDTVTGKVTFNADASASATSVTPGTRTTVVLSSNPGTLVNGKLLYLNGFTGADASLLNGKAHTIYNLTGSGPYTFELDTNTSGKTITLGAGMGYKYAQPSDTLTWSGEFDVPVRFDIDELNWSIVNKSGGGYIFNAETIPVVEVIP